MEINYKCPVCSTNVKIKFSDVGQTIRCPKCNLKINVKRTLNSIRISKTKKTNNIVKKDMKQILLRFISFYFGYNLMSFIFLFQGINHNFLWIYTLYTFN